MKLNRRTFLAVTGVAISGQAIPRAFGEAGAAEDQVIELRQYTLYGGKRDTLISLFERNFIEPQNAVGAHVLGTFRDRDDPDRFVWLRGFRDMTVRKQALESFYGGPVWQAHKSEANATMVDSDNVLLLRPVSPERGLSPRVTPPNTGAVYSATLHYLDKVNPAEFAGFFNKTMLPLLAAEGIHPLACLVSDESPNNFPRLPVRERSRVFVWLTRWNRIADYEAFVAHTRAWSGWRDTAPESVLPALMQKPERLCLIPTPRSQMQ